MLLILLPEFKWVEGDLEGAGAVLAADVLALIAGRSVYRLYGEIMSRLPAWRLLAVQGSVVVGLLQSN